MSLLDVFNLLRNCSKHFYGLVSQTHTDNSKLADLTDKKSLVSLLLGRPFERTIFLVYVKPSSHVGDFTFGLTGYN